MVSEEEQALIRERMAEAGIRNMGAYMRKMALNGYVLHVDLSPVRELVSLQRRCSNNLNQVAIQANTYGGIYPEEIAALQRDYAALWGPLSDLLERLSFVPRWRKPHTERRGIQGHNLHPALQGSGWKKRNPDDGGAV